MEPVVGELPDLGELVVVMAARGAWSQHATLVATAANMGGLDAGLLRSGLLTETISAPPTLPFLVHLAMLAIVTAGTWLMTVTVTQRLRLSVTCPTIPNGHGPPSRGLRPDSPSAASSPPSHPPSSAVLLRLHSPVLVGAVVCTLFAASTIGQMTLVAFLGRRPLVDGCVILMAGMVLLATALAAGSLTLTTDILGLRRAGIAFTSWSHCWRRPQPSPSTEPNARTHRCIYGQRSAVAARTNLRTGVAWPGRGSVR